MSIVMVRISLAKNIFVLHGVDQSAKNDAVGTIARLIKNDSDLTKTGQCGCL